MCIGYFVTTTKFPDKGSLGELSKPAGCSESESRCSPETQDVVADPFTDRGRLLHLSYRKLP